MSLMCLSSLTLEQRQRLAALRHARRVLRRNGVDANSATIEAMAKFILGGATPKEGDGKVLR